VSETVLTGGDLNVIVRVGDTVRRPTGTWSPAVHALLRHFESAGFDGAPRFLGVDEHGREILGFVEGEAALAPVPAADVHVFELGQLLRRMHDVQEGFTRPVGAAWQTMVGAPAGGEVVCHNDLFWTNVVLSEGRVSALVDWDLAAPAPRLHDLASAANFWVPLRPDEQAIAWGLPTHDRRARLEALCEGYGLPGGERVQLLDTVAAKNAIGLATYHRWGRDERRPGWRQIWDRDGDRYLRERQEWFDAHRDEVATWLR
jgi:hypothetical protein